MSESLRLALTFAAGLALGACFFGGLWWTVQRCLSASNPAVWLFSSLLLRTAAVLTGFYWIAGGSWQQLLVCGLGFFTARLIVTRRFLPPQNRSRPEQSHAP